MIHKQNLSKKINQVRYLSDLHLEQYQGMASSKIISRFLPPLESDKESLLILAGDISSDAEQLGDFLVDIAPNFAHVLCIPGNHEFYGVKNRVMTDQDMRVRLIIKHLDNVTYTGLDTYMLTFTNCTVIGNTLWADGGRHDRELAMVSRCLNDFRLIQQERVTNVAPYVAYSQFTVHDMRAKNLQFRDEILQCIADTEATAPLICATHHLPFYELCHPRFGGDIDGGFACNFSELKTLNRKPDYWIFGHTHDTNDVDIHGIKLLSNPSGYHKEFNHADNKEFNSFSPKIIEL